MTNEIDFIKLIKYINKKCFYLINEKLLKTRILYYVKKCNKQPYLISYYTF